MLFGLREEITPGKGKKRKVPYGDKFIEPVFANDNVALACQ